MENKKTFLEQLADNTDISFCDLDTEEISPEAVKLINENLARKHNVIPIRIKGNDLYLAMDDPLDFQAIDDVKLMSGKNVIPLLSTAQEIKLAIDQNYSGTEQAEKAIHEFNLDIKEKNENKIDISLTDIENAPIVRIVNSILTDAINMNASDIHIEPFEKEVRIRMRVDGDLKELLQLPPATLSGISTRIKIMSDLNIAETKRPQDGRTKMKIDGKDINMRISFLPTVYGEKIVIRLLNKSSGIIDKSQIGFTPYNLSQIEKLMKISEGIILLTGPTGSGKSTTLYSLLKDFNTIDKNIITLEDPVEYQMFGVNQVQVNSEIGMTFASGLRSILRQDPDIIMLGEIRDEETAQIAIRSAITGHIVLSTLHTNDTVSSLSRLADMGIPKYMVTSAIAGVVAQRLLKRVCPKCAEKYHPSKQEMEMLGISEDTMLTRGKGCPYCGNTGYKGRIAIHEVLVLNRDIKNMVNTNCSNDEIKDQARKEGMKTLEESARELVISGVTTVDEMVRATYNLD